MWGSDSYSTRAPFLTVRHTVSHPPLTDYSLEINYFLEHLVANPAQKLDVCLGSEQAEYAIAEEKHRVSAFTNGTRDKPRRRIVRW